MKCEYKLGKIISFLKEHPDITYTAVGISCNFRNISTKDVASILSRQIIPDNICIEYDSKAKNCKYTWRDII